MPEQMQISTKRDTIFKTLKIGNTQKPKLYTTPTYNSDVNYQNPIGSHSQNQPGHKYSTRQKIRWLRMGKQFDPRNMFQIRKAIYLELKIWLIIKLWKYYYY